MNIKEYLQPYVAKIVVIKGADGPDGRTFFPPWEKEREKYLYTGDVTDQNLREVLPDEIIIEFDHDTKKGTPETSRQESERWIERCRLELLKYNRHFYITDHKGKSPHIRFRIRGLDGYAKDYATLYKEHFVDALLRDINFSSEFVKVDASLYRSKSKLISLENAPHWKSEWKNTPELVIYENEAGPIIVDAQRMKGIIDEFYKSLSSDKRIDPIRIEPGKINITELQRIFATHYHEGRRNTFLMAFGGMCRKKGLSYDEAVVIWNNLLESCGYTDIVWRYKTNDEMRYSWDVEAEKVAVFYYLKNMGLQPEETIDLYQRLINTFTEQTMLDEILKYTMPLDVWLKDGIRSPEWIVDRLVPSKGFCLWGGQAGCYKTWVAMYLGLCITAGKPFLGEFEVKQGNVLYIDEENGTILLLNRLKDLIQGLQIPIPSNFVASIFSNIKIDVMPSDPSMLPLKAAVEKYEPKLVILDSTVRLMRGDENEASDVRNIFDNLKNLFLNKYDHIAFILLHHTNKAGLPGEMGSLRGSSDFAAAADVVMMFKKYSTTPGAIISLVKHRYIDTTTFKEFGVSAVKDGETLVAFKYKEIESGDSGTQVENAQEAIVKWLRDTGIVMFYKKDVLKFGASERTIQRALAGLCKEGVLHQENSKKPYTVVEGALAVPQEEDVL